MGGNKSKFLFQHVYHGVQHGYNERLQHHAERHLHLPHPEHLQHSVRESQHSQHHGLPHVQGLHVGVQGLHDCRLPRHELLHSLTEAESQAAPGWILLVLPPAPAAVPQVLVPVHRHSREAAALTTISTTISTDTLQVKQNTNITTNILCIES